MLQDHVAIHSSDPEASSLNASTFLALVARALVVGGIIVTAAWFAVDFVLDRAPWAGF